MATTSRYSRGARRRLSRSSSWQKKCRLASVEKSTKPKLTGFLTLYAYGPVNTTHEMWVWRTVISVVGCSYTERSVRAWISRFECPSTRCLHSEKFMHILVFSREKVCVAMLSLRCEDRRHTQD